MKKKKMSLKNMQMSSNNTTVAATAATSIYGGGGADTIKLSGNFSDAGLGHLIDGGDGADLIGKSTVDFVNAASGVSILGGAGNDTIKLERGATKLYINGGAGADSIFAATGIDSFSVLGGNGADTMTLVDNGYAKTSAGAYFDGGSGVDVFNQNAFLTAIAITSVLTKQSLANIAYGSGDIINLTTATSQPRKDNSKFFGLAPVNPMFAALLSPGPFT